MPTFALVLWIICGALMALFEKKTLEFMSWQSAALVHDFIAIATLPFFYYSYRADIRLRDISAQGLGWAIAASAVGLIAYFAYYAALRSFDASKLGAYGLTEVAVLAVLCAVFLGEALTASKAFAIALMVAGAWLLTRTQPPG